MSLLSIVVPVHNEEETIETFYTTVSKIVKDMDIKVEYIFVDDGSQDNTLNILNAFSISNKEIHYISFSRNFGKEAALLAGLKEAKGDFVVVMDVDLQDPPELLPDMYDEISNNGYDCVATRRSTRTGEGIIKSWFSKKFYAIINKISDVEFVDGARDFRMMTRQMINAILSLTENQRFSKGIFSWVGFNTKYISFENRERVAGSTKWSFFKLFKYAISGIVAFSTVPLAIISIIGVILFILSIICGIALIIRTLLIPTIAINGWTSIVVIILFFSGIQLMSLGVIGRYMESMYLETKKRPVYIIKEQK